MDNVSIATEVYDHTTYVPNEKENRVMQQILETQARIQEMAMGALWNSNGVAKFEVEDDDASSQDIHTLTSLKKITNWEMLEGEDFDSNAASKKNVIIDGFSLDKVLANISDVSKHFDATEDASLCTGSLSNYSLLSQAPSITFIPTDDDHYNLYGAKQRGVGKSGKKGKNHLRAIAALIDPRMDKRIKNRRGIWSGCYDDADKVYEKSVEVEYGNGPVEAEKKNSVVVWFKKISDNRYEL